MLFHSSTRFAVGFVLAVAALGNSGAAPAPPGGMNTVTFSTTADSVAFVAPGHKVDVCASVRTGNKLEAFTLLVDALVTAIETDGKSGVVTVTLSLTDKQAKAAALAKRRGCVLEVMARRPGSAAPAGFDLDEVIKSLSAVDVVPAPRPVSRPAQKGVLTLPDGHSLVSLRVGRVPELVVPAARVDVFATGRDGKKIEPILVLSDKQVVSVNSVGGAPTDGPVIAANSVSMAASEQEVQALTLAVRGEYRLEVVLRAPDQKKAPGYDLSAVIKALGAREVAPAPRAVERK